MLDAGEQTGLPQAHRFAFLQAVMERKWMPETEAKQLFATLDQLSGSGRLLQQPAGS